jgi:hypothetical protein
VLLIAASILLISLGRYRALREDRAEGRIIHADT